MLKNILMGTSGLWAMAAMAPADEPLDIVQLEGNLADAVKPPEVTAGKYVGEVQDVQEAVSQAGNKYYNVKFVISPDQLPAGVREHYEDGAVLYYNRLLKIRDLKDRRTIFNTKVFYSNLGLNNNITAVNPSDWMGCNSLLTVKMGSWQGEPRAEIAGLAPVEKAPARSTKTAAASEKEPAPARGRRR